MTLLVHILKPYLLVTHINFRFLATWRKHTLYFHEYFKTALKKSVAGYDRWNYTHKKPNKYHYIYMEVNTLWHCILPNTRLLKAWYPVTIYGTLNEAHIQKATKSLHIWGLLLGAGGGTCKHAAFFSKCLLLTLWICTYKSFPLRGTVICNCIKQYLRL